MMHASKNVATSQRFKLAGNNACETLAFAALALEPMYAAAAKERQGERTDLKPDIVADLPRSSPEQSKSREQAAKAVGAKGRTVSQDFGPPALISSPPRATLRSR